ncbi:MAG: hypothetical protein WC787_05020 [Patescibacteria group bacterium]|jgi:primosomal protein N'
MYTTTRIQAVLEQARAAKGRVLILTPWKQRAEMIAKQLDAVTLHADLADGAAWTALSSFTTSTSSILAATRIGAWLACVADTVIIDESENDDFKQDELAPRFDGRWIAETASSIRPSRSLIRVSTTPILSANPDPTTPSIELPLTLEPWQRGSRSGLAGLSGAAVDRIESAIEEKKPIIILHPVRGDRSRIHCRDCSWTMLCASCAFPVTAQTANVRCQRCGRTADLPEACPSCGGTDLNASRIGKDRLATDIAARFGNDIVVADLPEWHRLRVAAGSLVVLTDLSLIGGYVEDIRRRERLVISWRRLAASVASVGGELYALGPENALADARNWLANETFIKTWKEEWKERESFRYPPAKSRIKLLIDGDATKAEIFAEKVKTGLGETWIVEGPYPVAYRSKTRSERHVLHLLPPEGEDVHAALEPFAKEAIIDLDPIAFFS